MLPKYRITITKSAQKELSKLPQSAAIRLVNQIELLKTNPFPFGYKKLKEFCIKGYEYYPFFRVRVGDYRVIYAVENNILNILIIKIGHRKDIYN